MIYCPECGSEVASSDTFCAYCGIALSPLNIADAVPSIEHSENAQVSEDFKPSNTFPPGTLQQSSAEKTTHNNFDSNEDNTKSESVEYLKAKEYLSESNAPEIAENRAEKANAGWEEFPNAPISNTFTDESFAPVSAPSVYPTFDADKTLIQPVSEKSEATDDFAAAENKDSKVEENLPGQEIKFDGKIIANSEFEPDDYHIEKPAEKFAEDPADKPVDPAFDATIPDVSSELKQRFDDPQSRSLNSEMSVIKEIDITGSSEDPAPDFTVKPFQDLVLKPDSSSENKITEAESGLVNQTPLSAAPEGEPQIENLDLIDKSDLLTESEESEDRIFAEDNSEKTKKDPENLSSEPNIDAAAKNAESGEQKEGRSYTVPIHAPTDTDGKKSAKLKPLEEGTVLNGRYEIVRKIGGGGMGAVYLAGDRNLGGVLRAVKEMVQSYIEDSQQEKSVNDFRRESMILSTLDHPAIPTIYDYFFDEKESRFYLVMKYINGGDLAARLRSSPEGKIEEKTVTEWAIQIADVLDYLHNRPTPIIYRDLKPSNIMIDGNAGRAMLIDFGIARSVNKEEKGVTAVGTMGYAPPELFSGNVEPRSDIYSLGSTMFHLLTGADPQSNPLLIFDFNKNPRPRQINSRLSDQIEQILMRAVQYNSSQRFNSAAEMRDILKTHLENLNTGAVTYGVAAAIPAQSKGFDVPVFCGFCGQKILATDVFCPFCGAKQPILNQPASASKIQTVQKTARLIIIGTTELSEPEYVLEKDENLVGRRDPMSNIFPEIDLSKFDPQTKISRRHARIRLENNQYLIEDLGSSNGTILMSRIKDSVRLQPHQSHILAGGDKIKVGDTILQFIVG